MPIVRNGEKEGEAKQDTETTLIPKTLLMGKTVRPGDKIILEVSHIYEDEVEVFYPKEKKTPMEESNDELDSMAEPAMGTPGGMGPPAPDTGY